MRMEYMCKYGSYCLQTRGLLHMRIEYRSVDVTKLYFWNFKILTIWSERAPYNRHASKVSNK